MFNKNLFIIKGCSGSGKTTLAEYLTSNLSCKSDYFEADRYMVDESGNYKFSVENLTFCHKKCQNAVESAMLHELPLIILSNTSTKIKDIQPYLDLAKKYNYNVTSLILENLHGNKDLHNVPEQVLIKQENHIKLSLKLR